MASQQVGHVDISLLPIQRAIEQYAKDTQNRSRLNKPRIDGQPTGVFRALGGNLHYYTNLSLKRDANFFVLSELEIQFLFQVTLRSVKVKSERR